MNDTTLLHRDFQIAGNSSHLTGRQGFRTNDRNHPPEISHNKSPSQKETASVHVTQKESTNNCLQKNTEAENYRTETHQPAATLQILPINLHNQQRSTAVYALLDSGSTSSFLTKNIAEKLKLTPKTTTTLNIKGFNAAQTINSTVVDLQISDIENRKTHNCRNVYVVDNDQLPTVKEHPKQIADNYGHLRDIQLPHLSNLNVEALLGCDKYALIIARQHPTDISILHQRMMSTFAKHVKTTSNNCLKMSKNGGTWNLMDPKQQPKTQRLTTKTKHLKYSQTLAAKQMTYDSKQDSS